MKYEKIVKQFQDSVFGTLTTIRSFKDPKKIWFLGAEIQNLLGFINLTQAINDAKIKSNEKFILSKSINPEFWDEFVTIQQIGAKIRRVTFVSESGLYKLILRSNKPNALKFSDWVTSDVLPTLRENVEGSLVMKRASFDVEKHLDIEHQKFESKRINKININTVGVVGTVRYNRDSCLDHSGMTPRDLKNLAKRNGIPASKRTSGKEVLRIIDMPTASSMSLTDSLVADGLPYEKAKTISVNAGKQLFKEMIEAGIKPKELDM